MWAVSTTTFKNWHNKKFMEKNSDSDNEEAKELSTDIFWNWYKYLCFKSLLSSMNCIDKKRWNVIFLFYNLEKVNNSKFSRTNKKTSFIKKPVGVLTIAILSIESSSFHLYSSAVSHILHIYQSWRTKDSFLLNYLRLFTPDGVGIDVISFRKQV